MSGNLQGSNPDAGPATPESGEGGPSAPRQASRPAFLADFAELASGIFVSPVATLKTVAARADTPLGPALLVYSLVVLVNGLASSVTISRSLAETLSRLGAAPALSPTTIAVAMIASLLLYSPIALFFKAGALSLTGAFFGGTGDGRRLLAAFALTYAPAVLNTPATLLVSRSGSGGAVLALVFTLAILAWRLVLDIVAIREVYSLSTGKAVAAALAPIGALVLITLVFVTVLVMASLSTAGLTAPHTISGVG